MADKANDTDVPAGGEAVSPFPAEIQDEPRWSAWRAITATWVFPKTAASRMQHVSLGKAFLVHCSAAMVGLVLVYFVLTWDTEAYPHSIVHGYNEVLAHLATLKRDLSHSWVAVGLLQARYVLAVECGFLLIALIVSPWGAGDEPFRESIRNSIRQTWLHSIHFLPVILIVWLAGYYVAAQDRAWVLRRPTQEKLVWPESRPVQGSPPDPAYAEKLAEYNVAMRATNAQAARYGPIINAYYARQPWICQHPRVVVVNAYIVAALWLLWALLRAVGAPRKFPPTARDAACEFCGYNLTTIPIESRCPECGEPVAKSLGANVRLGCPWSQLPANSRKWFDTVTLAAGETAKLGRQLRLFPTDVAHRRFVMWSLPPAFAIGFLGVLLTLVVNHAPSDGFIEILLIAGPIVGGLSVCGAAILPNLAALLVSAFYGFSGKRNLMPGAIQIACYLAGYVMLYLIAGNIGMTCAILAFQEPFGWLELLAEAVHLQKGMLAFLSFWLANATMLIFYVILVARGTAAMRYANR